MDRIDKNILWLYAGKIIAKGGSLLLNLYAARMLSQQAYGQYAYIFSITSIAFMLADMGMSTYYIKRWARQPRYADTDYAIGYTIRLTGCILAMAAFIIYAWLLPGIRLPLLIAAAATFLDMFRGHHETWFNSQQDLHLTATLQTTERLLTMAFGSILLWKGYGLPGLCAGFLASHTITYALGERLVDKRWHVNLSWTCWKTTLAKSWPYLALTMTSLASQRIHLIILPWFTDYSTTAIYAAANNLTQGTSFIAGTISAALLPAMSATRNQDIGRRYLRRVAIVSGIGIILALAFADIVISILYPPTYAASATILRLLAIAQGFAFLNAIQGTMLLARDKHKQYLTMTATMAISAIMLDMALIPLFHATGAAITAIGIETASAIWLWRKQKM